MTDALMIAPLTENELEYRAELEMRVEGGLAALLEIKERNLWRDYESFSAYVRARFGYSERQTENKLNALAVIGLLRASLESTVVPTLDGLSEYALRPIVALDGERKLEIYERAVQIADGGTPTHAQVAQAKAEIMSRTEIQAEAALAQLFASPFSHLQQEARAGGNAVTLLALADCLSAAEPAVRQLAVALDLHDMALVRAISRGFREGRESAQEVVRTRHLQFGDGESVALAQATIKDWQRLSDEKYREHLAQVYDQKRGQAVSVVVFRSDPEGTLDSLKKVLPYSELIALANLIGEM